MLVIPLCILMHISFWELNFAKECNANMDCKRISKDCKCSATDVLNYSSNNSINDNIINANSNNSSIKTVSRALRKHRRYGQYKLPAPFSVGRNTEQSPLRHLVFRNMTQKPHRRRHKRKKHVRGKKANGDVKRDQGHRKTPVNANLEISHKSAINSTINSQIFAHTVKDDELAYLRQQSADFSNAKYQRKFVPSSANMTDYQKNFYGTSIFSENSNILYFPTQNFGNIRNNEVEDESTRYSPSINTTADLLYRVLQNGEKGHRRFSSLNTYHRMKKVVVRMHNILRGKVYPPAKNMLAMSWNGPAAKQAQRWADTCRLDADEDHLSMRWTAAYGTCGQNVYIAFKKKRWNRVIRQWWNERRFFHYGYGGNNIAMVGKYTQMVWYNSHKVGCGISQCSSPNGKMFYRYVCNYCPAGNDPRRLSWPYVEGEQCGSCPSSCKSLCQRNRCKLCTNTCPFSDLWSNCESLAENWKQWLCNTKTADGIIRFTNCRATCLCQDKIK